MKNRFTLALASIFAALTMLSFGLVPATANASPVPAVSAKTPSGGQTCLTPGKIYVCVSFSYSGAQGTSAYISCSPLGNVRNTDPIVNATFVIESQIKNGAPRTAEFVAGGNIAGGNCGRSYSLSGQDVLATCNRVTWSGTARYSAAAGGGTVNFYISAYMGPNGTATSNAVGACDH